MPHSSQIYGITLWAASKSRVERAHHEDRRITTACTGYWNAQFTNDLGHRNGIMVFVFQIAYALHTPRSHRMMTAQTEQIPENASTSRIAIFAFLKMPPCNPAE